MNRILAESKIVIMAAFALLFVTGRGNSVVYASGEASNRQMETLENSPWGFFDDEETSDKTSDENSVWDSFGWINDEESSLADPSTESEPVKPDTPSEEELLQKLYAVAGTSVVASYYDDFDANGTSELFAVTGQIEKNKLWFVSNLQVEELAIKGAAYYDYGNKAVCPLSSGKKLFIMESGGFGSGSFSNCYYVVDDTVRRVEHAGEGLMQLEGDEFAVHPSAFDALTDAITGESMGGHTWKRYYLKWTGSSFEEYVGTEITQYDLLQYKGADEILQQAWEHGYFAGTIISRENGIINVNLYQQDNGCRNNENLTLKVEGNRVDLVKIHDTANDWVGQYSYCGVYQVSGF